MARAQKRSRSAKPASVLPPLAPRKRALHSIAPTRCRSASLAQRPVVERDARVADAVLMHARKKLALLQAGSRAEDVAEAKAKRHQAAAFLEERKAEFDQCTVRAPAAGTRQGSRHPRPVRLDFCVHDARSTEAGREVTDEGLRQGLLGEAVTPLATGCRGKTVDLRLVSIGVWIGRLWNERAAEGLRKT